MDVQFSVHVLAVKALWAMGNGCMQGFANVSGDF